MFRKTIATVICLAGLLPFKSKGQTADNTVQVLIVRHAEKEAGGSTDPDLSQAGRERATQLASMLKEVPVNILYATMYKRTRQTLGPLAAARKLEIQTYDPANQKALADLIVTATGKTIVVAGHANTAPALVNLLLGEERYSTLPEDVFGNMWLLTLKDGKALSCLLINTNYH